MKLIRFCFFAQGEGAVHLLLVPGLPGKNVNGVAVARAESEPGSRRQFDQVDSWRNQHVGSIRPGEVQVPKQRHLSGQQILLGGLRLGRHRFVVLRPGSCDKQERR